VKKTIYFIVFFTKIGVMKMSGLDLSKMQGCKHCPGDRPTYRTCMNCGRPVCYECVIEEAISQKVSRMSLGAGFGSSGDATVGAVGGSTSTSISYVSFCPACYLRKINNPSYNILTGFSLKRWSTIEPNAKPKFFRDAVSVLFVFPLSLLTMYITLVIRIMAFMAEKNSYQRYIENKQKAERALGIKVSYNPSQSTRNANYTPRLRQQYCKKCGQPLDPLSSFCTECGTSIRK